MANNLKFIFRAYLSLCNAMPVKLKKGQVVLLQKLGNQTCEYGSFDKALVTH